MFGRNDLSLRITTLDKCLEEMGFEWLVVLSAFAVSLGLEGDFVWMNQHINIQRYYAGWLNPTVRTAK